LPPDWEEAVSASTGRTYYWHAATGESSYDRPCASGEAAAAGEPAAAAHGVQKVELSNGSADVVTAAIAEALKKTPNGPGDGDGPPEAPSPGRRPPRLQAKTPSPGYQPRRYQGQLPEPEPCPAAADAAPPAPQLPAGGRRSEAISAPGERAGELGTPVGAVGAADSREPAPPVEPAPAGMPRLLSQDAKAGPAADRDRVAEIRARAERRRVAEEVGLGRIVAL
jgi:hypothetical protein